MDPWEYVEDCPRCDYGMQIEKPLERPVAMQQEKQEQPDPPYHYVFAKLVFLLAFFFVATMCCTAIVGLSYRVFRMAAGIE